MRRTVWVVLGLLLLWQGTSQGACTLADIATELNTDPAALGYAPYVAARNDRQLAAILNTVQAGAPYVVSKGVVTRDQAAGTWGDIITNVVFLSNENPTYLKEKWSGIVDRLFTPRITVDYADAQVADWFSQMVTDALLKGDGNPITAPDVVTRTTKQGTRAQVVCSEPNRIISVSEVTQALNL